MTTLIIDNYDSFTWNLHQLVGTLGGEPRVVRNDAISMAEIRRLAPARVILSPGPGRPDDPSRIGVMRDVILSLEVPILGVCLGHQCIVHTFGGTVVRGEPVHGKTALVAHAGQGILAGLPRPFEAMRYHSLVAGQVPEELEITGWIARAEAECKVGEVMAVRHRTRPIFGVQFHPESVGTPNGADLCRAFLRGDFS